MRKQILIAIMMLLMATAVYAIGNFKVEYPAGTWQFLVDNSGNVTMKGTLFNASATTSALFGTDAIKEAAIDMDTSCAAGNHLYVNGNDFACEADANTGNCSAAQSCTGIVYDGNLSVYSKFGDCGAGTFVQNTTATGVECATPTASGDGNNYTEAISVSGTTTKTINVDRVGMINLTAGFTDIDTTIGNCSTDQSCDTIAYLTANTFTGHQDFGGNITLTTTTDVGVSASSYFTIDASGNFIVVLV